MPQTARAYFGAFQSHLSPAIALILFLNFCSSGDLSKLPLHGNMLLFQAG